MAKTKKAESTHHQAPHDPSCWYRRLLYQILNPLLITAVVTGITIGFLYRPQTLHIIVIGGGIAGLGAAHSLTAAAAVAHLQIKVTLLEAKDRLGGRLHTVYLNANNTPIDMGGMYWHGNESPAMKFLQSLSETVPSGGKSNLPGQKQSQWKIYKSDDDTWATLTAEELEHAHQLYQQWDSHMKEQYWKHTMDNLPTATCESQQGAFSSSSDDMKECSSFLEYNDTAESILLLWSNRFLGTLSTSDRHLVEFIKTMSFQLDRGVPLEELAVAGLHNDWDWKDVNGTDHVAVYGMKHVVDRLVQTMNNVCTIVLGERVTRIDYSAANICAVETESGQLYSAGACVVTIPLGVLKQKAEYLFHPQLPLYKKDALRRAGVGIFNTLAIHWKAPICDSATSHFLIAHPNLDNPLRFGFICSAQLRNPRETASITQFYFSGKDYSFDDMTYWKEQALEVVRAVQSAVELSDIDEVYISQWHSDPDVLGSYSSATRQTKGNGDRKILAEPLGNSVFFAGEHTHFEGRYQSIDGAFESGLRAASQLLSRSRWSWNSS
jgi:polyamine oxidase